MLGMYLGGTMELLLGVIYPVYGSFKTLRSTKDKDADNAKWMPYWIVFSLFSATEFILDFLFAFWCPFWYEFKILFVVWLQPNYFDGAHKVWTKYIEPAIESKAPYIDEKTEFVVKRVRNISADDLTQLIDWVTVQGQAVVGIKVADAPAKKTAAPAAEKQEDKPDEAEEVLVEEEKKNL
ncbi:receptor expression-enhancing protein 1-like protein [Chrysochromulina tobinii]|uniref:Receptor expression-enhancing protein 1-like protein n=1 Tax=Chrysochromulina tobinii TaxID=1460289 RepID=A0A0M0J4Y2_9EUKA|nr:receptor expression-enhancing protein 1-like protein [Chrysochromulina tobinii]|eukprot:KOO21382.1 receptor expression-enhancing protein 1-like protein [Chrysochromulina sp. CCMP291]